MSSPSSKSVVENFNRDLLVKMTDVEVNEALMQHKNRIESLSRRGENTKSLETEFCYIQDEAQRRAKYSPFFAQRESQDNSPEA